METLGAAMCGTQPRGPLCYCKCAINHITAVPMNYLVSKRIPNAEAFLVHCERLSMKSKSVVFRQGEPSEDLYLILDGSVSVIVDDIEDPEQEMVLS